MILVDVIFPELDKIIDFYLDEDAPCRDILEELATMAARSCGREFHFADNAVLLYSVGTQRVLNLNLTLRENGVHSGERLLFV